MFSTTRNDSSKGNIIEFKAGRCKLEPGSGTTKRNVVAEREKGLVFIRQSSDQLMHFCWKNRESGALIDDLIIFPGDTEFKEVKGCTNGQVFMLKFKSSEERRLFWLQESSIEGDVVQKVNDALNKPPPPRPSGRERNTTGGGLAHIGAGDTGFPQEIGALGGLDQNQLMQLLQFMNPGSSSEPPLAGILAEESQNLPEREQSQEALDTEPVGEQQSPGTTADEAQPEKKKEQPPSEGRGQPDDEMELD